MSKKVFLDFIEGIRIVPKASTSSARKGDLEVLDSDSRLYYHNGTVNSAVVTEASSGSLTGKTYSAVNGSAASPSFTFDNSPTTGLYRIGADIIGLSIAGTERARLDASTFLMRGGISSGVASTTSGSLSIFTSTGTNSFGVSMASNTEARLSVSGSSAMTFYTNANERLAISSSGVATFSNVLRAASGTKTAPTYSYASETTTGMYLISSGMVGLSLLDTIRYEFSPGYLSYYGSASSVDTTPGNGASSLSLSKNSTSGEGALVSYGSGGSNFLSFYTNTGGAAATEKFRIASDGEITVNGGTLTLKDPTLGSNTFTLAMVSTTEGRLRVSGASTLTIYTGSDERVTVDSSGNFEINGGQLRLEDPGVGLNTVRLQAPSGLAATYTLTLPVDDGTANQFLITDGSGVLSWSSTSPGAGAYQVSGSRGTPNSITAAGGITSTADSRLLMFIEGGSPTLGVTDITANPQISAGVTIGQELLLIGRNNAAKLLLQNGNGLSLSGDKLLGEDDTLSLIYDGSVWVEVK